MKAKKLLALLMALVMTFGLAVTAFAAEVPGAAFSDVAGHWAEEYVDRVTELGLIDSKTADTFAPDDSMTRADLAVALYRLAGSPAPAAGAQNPFADVADDAPYRDAVLWAFGKGILDSRTADTIAPTDGMERQEFVTMMNLFAADAVGQAKLASREDVMSGYPDAASVSDWAKDAMNWAVASEYIIGSGGKLMPQGAVTRAQAATILCRYLDDAGTGDASLDNPRNEDGIGENELLVVSFGTSFNDSRRLTIGAIEDALEEAFPEYSVRRGFTSNIIIEHVVRRDGEVIDDVTEALDRAVANGVKNLLVQPTHLMNGYEYGDLVKELQSRKDDFETIRIGAPLLTTDADYQTVAEALVAATASYDDGKTAICFMGHGTEAASNGVYAKMQQVLKDGGHDNYFVGTVEAEPSVETVLKMVQEGGYEKVVLRPMMIVAGDHANNDMAGDEEDSWKSTFEAAGYEVECLVNGMGELEGIQQLLVAHAREALPLDETGIAVEPNPGASKELADGTYTISVTSDSSMFRVTACELTVSDGTMTAVLTLGGTSYDKLFVGTKEQAGAAAEGFVDFVENAEGAYTFTVPVAALDTVLPYAAHSVKSGNWFDRGLTFESATAAAK
ncbi:MAG: sirohydrochlorin cobaltochelatase [Oscillospiraceae bacterium]